MPLERIGGWRIHQKHYAQHLRWDLNGMKLGSLNNLVGAWQNRLAPLNFSIGDTTREQTE